MSYYTFLTIIAIMFWVLSALGVVTFMAWGYCQVQYYKWDKEDRIKNELAEKISEQVGEMIDVKINPGGGISKDEN